MLSALSIAIPLVFRGTLLQIYIPALQYSGTVASHVPSMLAIAVGPVAAVVVGLASTIGFAATLGPIVAARAFTHVIWGLAAAIYVSRGGSYVKGLLLVALPIHAAGEGIAIFALGPLFGAIQVAAETAGLLVFAGTLIHHLIDSVISIAVLRVVKPLLVPLLPHLAHTKLAWSVAIRKGPLHPASFAGGK